MEEMDGVDSIMHRTRRSIAGDTSQHSGDVSAKFVTSQFLVPIRNAFLSDYNRALIFKDLHVDKVKSFYIVLEMIILMYKMSYILLVNAYI